MSFRLTKTKMYKTDGDLVIPRDLFKEMRGTFFLAIYVRSRKKIEIIPIEKDVIEKCKIFDVLLLLEENTMPIVIRMMKEVFEDFHGSKAIWSSGVCSIDESLASTMFHDYTGCLWESILIAPDSISLEKLKDKIMGINERENKLIVKKIEIEEQEIPT